MSHGNPIINRLMDQLKEANGGMLDGSIAQNRRSCHVMLARMKSNFPDFDPEQSLSRLIAVGKKDPFHGPNLTSFQYLVYNASKIINNARAARSKQGPVTDYEGASQSLADRIAARKAGG